MKNKLDKVLSKREVLGALKEAYSGEWLIKMQVLSQACTYETVYGDLRFVNLKGWCFIDFKGDKRKGLYPAKEYELARLLDAYNKEYLFKSNLVKNYMKKISIL